MLLQIPTHLGAAAERPLSYYVGVDEGTLKRRSKQLDGTRGEWEWEFVQSVVACESNFRYTAQNKSSAAAGLYGFMPIACKDIGVNFDDLKRSVEIQLKAGRKLLAMNRREIMKSAPLLLTQGDKADLYAIAYYGHNRGIYAMSGILKMMTAAGVAPTFSNFRLYAQKYLSGKYYGAAKMDKAAECASLAPRWKERYAELVLGQANAVATMSSTGDEPLVSGSQKPEGDGETIAYPPSLDVYEPVYEEPSPNAMEPAPVDVVWSTGSKVFLGVTVAVAASLAAYVVVKQYRPNWLRRFA